jgi:hypothetical protein
MRPKIQETARKLTGDARSLNELAAIITRMAQSADSSATTFQVLTITQRTAFLAQACAVLGADIAAGTRPLNHATCAAIASAAAHGHNIRGTLTLLAKAIDSLGVHLDQLHAQCAN